VKRIVMLAALAGGCTTAETAPDAVRVDILPGGITRTVSSQPVDSGRWQLVRVRDIQAPEADPGELASPQDVAITDEGFVLVADAQPSVVKVFDPSGAFVRAIGREGAGPGEFRSAYIAVLGDSLVVQDATNGRATTFNWRTGAMLSERRTSQMYFFPIGIDGSGRAAVRLLITNPDSSRPNVQRFVRFKVNEQVADTIDVDAGGGSVDSKPWVVREGNRMIMSVVVPFQPRAFHAVDRRGGFLTGYSSEYMLRRTQHGADTVGIFGRTWTPTGVSREEKSAIVEQRIAEVHGNNRDMAQSTIRASFDPAQIPDSRPAFEGVWVDAEGRSWVRRTERDTTNVRFDLFDERGRWLDVLGIPSTDWPASPWIPIALGRREVAVPLEGDDGRPLIRVFRLSRGQTP
jgi:hypothetical protein